MTAGTADTVTSPRYAPRPEVNALTAALGLTPTNLREVANALEICKSMIPAIPAIIYLADALDASLDAGGEVPQIDWEKVKEAAAKAAAEGDEGDKGDRGMNPMKSQTPLKSKAPALIPN